MNALVRFDADGPSAHIAIDDGKANVMSLAMLQAIDAAIDRAASDGLAIVLRGREGMFSAGFDLKVFAANDVAQSHAMVRAGAELALKLLSYPLPTLALCTGHAFPMGAFLLLASDVRIGVDGPYRIGLNEVAIGIAVPSFGLELARQRLTPAYLNRTATTGEMFSPTEAAAAGFLDRVVPPAQLDEAAGAALAAMTATHLESVGIVKQRLRRRAIASIREAIDREVTPEAYQASAAKRAGVRLPGRG